MTRVLFASFLILLLVPARHADLRRILGYLCYAAFLAGAGLSLWNGVRLSKVLVLTCAFTFGLNWIFLRLPSTRDTKVPKMLSYITSTGFFLW